MKLNSAQREAVEYLEGPLLVLAGPGTGKTQLLSQKVAYILENTDAGAENILCLTFTESGASNMRERLKTIIGSDALKVTIGTYHTFGSEILGMYRAYSEDYNRKLDEAIDEVRQFKIVKEIQGKLPGMDILRGDAVKDIVSVISDAKGAGLTAEDLRVIAEQNIEDSRVLSEAISPLLLNVVPRKFQESYDGAYRPIYELLKDFMKTRPILKKVERNINIVARDLTEAMTEAEASQKIKPLTSWKDKYFEKDARDAYRLKDRVANKKLLSLAGVMRQYEEYLRGKGWYDFDDMIEEAVRALSNDAGFKATLSERYQFILLDEFQDTNPSQLAIVKELTDYEKPLIMAVGDDDQAIYEFQGALSSNLADFRDYYGAKVVKLTENYRSTGEILAFSHEIIRQALDRFEDKVLKANRPGPASSQIYRYEFNSSDEEYGWVADKIAELVASGVEQRQIAVISAKHKYFEPFLPYLKAKEGVKIAYEKRDNLFEDEKIHEILSVAQLIWELANERQISVPILEILTYKWLKLSAIEVVKMVGQAKANKRSVFEVMGAYENSAITEVAEWLAEMVTKSFNEPLEQFLQEIIAKMGADEMGEYERFRFYENIASLLGKVRRHYGEKKLRLGDLIEMVTDYEVAEMPLNTTSPYKDAESAVRIMTAHKAKGLEFEYVFIIAADHTVWGKGKGNNNLLVLPKNLTQIRHTGVTDGEKLRVLYVALTRAKSHLYITNSVTDFNGKLPERLEYLEESVVENVEGEKEVRSPFLPTGKVVQMQEVVDFVKREENLRNWLASYIVQAPDMRAIYQERMAGLKMSASALTTFIDIINAGPEEFFRSRILQAPREPESESLVLGNLLHATFEAVTREGLTDEAATEFYLRALDEYDTTVEIREALRERGAESVVATLAEFGEIIREGKAEVAFGGERLVVNGVPVTGKIDHLVIDEEAKTIEVYDYKTSTYRTAGWKSHPTLYKYMLQLIFYKMLLETSNKYRNYKVIRGHILFVMKDKADGMVHDKVYDFNADDEKELRELLVAVYKLVSTLEFLDDPGVMIGPDKSRTMKDIRAFISLLLARVAEK